MADDKESRSRRWAIDGPYWWIGMLATMALFTPWLWHALVKGIIVEGSYCPDALLLISPSAMVVIVGIETRFVARFRWGAALIGVYLLLACFGIALYLALLVAGRAPDEDAWNIFVAGFWAVAMFAWLPKFYRLVFRRSKGSK